MALMAFILAVPSPSPSPATGTGDVEEFLTSPIYWCILGALGVLAWVLRRLHIGEHGQGRE